MRLKQLLGVLVLLLALRIAAAAAGSQLTKVSVASQGNTTTVTLRASGAFTHNEYKPADNLLLVDLPGVSAGRFSDNVKPLITPGVKSYRVLGYTGPGGTQVTRFELALIPGAVVDVAPVAGGLQIHISGGGGVSAAAPTAPSARPAPVVKPVGSREASSGRVVVRDISVLAAKDTLNVQIAATGALSPRASRLANPDRLVIDLANAVPGRARTIPVHSRGVKVIRMAQFQENPPVTRVVVDMVKFHDYDLTPDGNQLMLKIHTPEPVVAAAPPETAPAPRPIVPVVEKAPEKVAAPVPAVAESKPEPEKPAAASPEPVVQAKSAGDTAAKMFETKPDPGLLPPASASFQAAANLAQEQRQAMAQPKPETGPRYTGEPISVNLKDVDLRDFFRLIHEISGLNIVLDPNVKGSLTLVLDDVPWDQALDIVLKNNGLDRQLEGNVLRIATLDTLKKEADARREHATAEALAVPKITVTRYLSYAHSKEVVPTIKKFLSQRGDIISDDRTNALIIQDIPNVIPEIDRLIQQLDRKTQEVEIEARVVSATRSFARDIGTQLGFGWGNNVSAVGGASSVGTSPIKITFPEGTVPKYFVVGTDQIPLFTALGVTQPTSGISFTNATPNYRLDLILTAAESRGLVKILSRPRVVTQNNIQAIVRQGLRVPVVTQAQLGGPPTTQYIQADLRMTVTPQITVENTIFLNIDVENTTPDFSRTVGGNPTMITQQAQTQVLVADGGTVMIGGVIQTQNNVNTQQVPFLGDLPIFGNLFKRRTVSTSSQELIFFIIPKIIQT